MSGEEEWVKAAMTDDAMVVDFLVRLHTVTRPPPPLLDWSVRQRRSKRAAHIASPTTPLSWSSGGGGGGFTDSSGQKLSYATRSKISGDFEKFSLKRSRKKKTLAELKGEEISLEKEKRELKKELAALRTNLEKQRVANQKLKRMKMELQPLTDRAENAISNQAEQKSVVSNPMFMLPDLNVPSEENNVLS